MTAAVDVPIDSALVRRLVADQFPHWQDLPVRQILPGGWDNRSFRLGPALLARLPSAAAYAPQVATEHRWLPQLAPRLPLPIPVPIAIGRPGHGYPFAWSVLGWLEGEPATTAAVPDRLALARDLAGFLNVLHALPGRDGPEFGPRNFWRGAPPAAYDAEVEAALARLKDAATRRAAAAVWREALASCWPGLPVWLHGDIAPANLLIRDGRLAAVIDFGGVAVGDPACDLAIAWRGFDHAMRAAFRERLALDDATWARGRGWALWKALILVTGIADAPAWDMRQARAQLADILQG